MNDEHPADAAQSPRSGEETEAEGSGPDRLSRPSWAQLDRCWQFMVPTGSLPGGELHLWLADLAQPEYVIRRCRDVLADDELKRADAFRFERHRSRFTVARAFLRRLLGWYLNTDPTDISFVYGKQGKPCLAPKLRQQIPPERRRLRFNVSHSGTLALYGFVQAYEIGVDIERYRALRDMMSIARRSFAQGEYATLVAAPPGERLMLFFNCWTRKEAYVKAVGDGLSLSLDSFEVTMSEEAPVRLLRIDGEPFPERRWRLVAVPIMPEVAAAVCVQPGNLVLRTFRLDEALCRL